MVDHSGGRTRCQARVAEHGPLPRAVAPGRHFGYKQPFTTLHRPFGTWAGRGAKRNDAEVRCDAMSEPQLAQLIQLLLMAATVLGLVWVAVPGQRPWRVVGRSVRDAATRPARLAYFGALCSILVVNYLYLALGADAYLTQCVRAWRGADFTPLIHGRIEGDAVARTQAAVAWLPLTWVLGYVYVVAFGCLVLAAVFVFDHWRDRRHLAMLLLGYLFNYLIGVPFYLFVPVRECFVYYQEAGAAGGPAARLLLDDISPAIMHSYRAMSGVDNCFPSFHTSLSVTVALVAVHAGRPRFAWAIGLLAVANVVSTVYLGVHWFTDVAGGLLVGWLVYHLARRLSRRWARAV